MTGQSHIPISEFLDRVETLAPLPEVARRVIQITEDEQSTAYDLALVMATDTALMAKLLRLANSAYYGYPRRISTVRDAVVLIGFRAVRSTAIAASIIDLYPASDTGPFSVDLFWGHSVACGMMAESIAQETGRAKPQESFTVGILHDLGRLLLNQYQTERFGQTIWKALQQGMSLHDAEEQEFGYDHALLGARLAERWNFPEEICRAIAEHHQPEPAVDASGLSLVVRQANALCHWFGLWCGFDGVEGARLQRSGVLADSSEHERLYEVVTRRVGGLEEMEERVKAFLQGARGRESRWYGQEGSPGSDRPAAEEPAA